MKSFLLIPVLVLGACAVETGDDEPETGEVESHGTTYQGTTYQGTTYQGTTYQGTTYQGTTYQGTTYQGTTYQSAKYGTSSISGTVIIEKSTIELWRKISSTQWEQRTPTQRCLWNSTQDEILSCSTYSLASSPLVNARFRGRFYDPSTGGTRYGTLQINAVSTDTSYAMHPLNGNGTGSLMAYNGTTCMNLEGCRRNSDLYLYDLRLLDSDGSVDLFCNSGERAFAFNGTWDLTGKYTSSSTNFTFACTNGTIAKCARWGYRPFGNATTVGAQHVSKAMLPFHQSCVRAATADYCASGVSYTRDGTLIDIYDHEPHASYEYGFIGRTQSMLYVQHQALASALQFESRFDNKGATELDFERYNDHGDVFSTCPYTFSLGTAPTPNDPHQPITRDPSTFSGPWVSVDTTSVCAHDEMTVGKSLDFRCSACTTRFWNLGGYEHCTARGGQWSADCAWLASQSWWCPASERMGYISSSYTTHSECTTGSKLYQYGSACTLRLCSNPSYASCCSSSWTSSCTAAANAQCVGGQEGWQGAQEVGFCGQPTGGLVLGP